MGPSTPESNSIASSTPSTDIKGRAVRGSAATHGRTDGPVHHQHRHDRHHGAPARSQRLWHGDDGRGLPWPGYVVPRSGTLRGHRSAGADHARGGKRPVLGQRLRRDGVDDHHGRVRTASRLVLRAVGPLLAHSRVRLVNANHQPRLPAPGAPSAVDALREPRPARRGGRRCRCRRRHLGRSFRAGLLVSLHRHGDDVCRRDDYSVVAIGLASRQAPSSPRAGAALGIRWRAHPIERARLRRPWTRSSSPGSFRRRVRTGPLCSCSGHPSQAAGSGHPPCIDRRNGNLRAPGCDTRALRRSSISLPRSPGVRGWSGCRARRGLCPLGRRSVARPSVGECRSPRACARTIRTSRTLLQLSRYPARGSRPTAQARSLAARQHRHHPRRPRGRPSVGTSRSSPGHVRHRSTTSSSALLSLFWSSTWPQPGTDLSDCRLSCALRLHGCGRAPCAEITPGLRPRPC